MKILSALKANKLTILVGVTSLAFGLSIGAGAVNLSAKSTPMVSATKTPLPDASGDPGKMDISASGAEDIPDLPISPEDPNLPVGSLDPVSDPAFPTATNQLELSFFKRAEASCDALKAKGAKFYHWDGSYDLWAKGSDGSLVANFFDAQGAYKGTSAGFGYQPSICDPSGVNEQRLRGNKLFASMYWLESIDGVEYIWHSHQGGPEVSTVHFYFTNGLITSASENVGGTKWVRYGLNALELKSALNNYEK